MSDLDKMLDQLLAVDEFSKALDSGDLFTLLGYFSINSDLCRYLVNNILREDKEFFNRNIFNTNVRLSPFDITNKSNRYSGLDIDNKIFSDNLRILHQLKICLSDAKIRAEISSGFREGDCYLFFYTIADTKKHKLKLEDTYIRIPGIGSSRLTYGYTIPTEPCYSKIVEGAYQALSSEDQLEINTYLCESLNALYEDILRDVKTYFNNQIGEHHA